VRQDELERIFKITTKNWKLMRSAKNKGNRKLKKNYE
jgi:hypothetical protein